MTADAIFSHPLFAQLAAVVGLAFLVETAWLLATRRLAFAWSEQAANVAVFMVGEGIRLAMRGVFVAGFVFASGLTPLHWATSPVAAVMCFLGVELCFYAWHRLLHRTRLGFALHAVHHTGESYALALGGRLPWPLRLVDDFICLPMVLLGFEPLLVFLCMAASFAVQFLAHAAVEWRLGPLDWILNTPATHRVHHDLAGPGQQRNFGGAIMLWDHLFGTFAPPRAVPAVGVEGLHPGANLLAIQLQGLVRWWKGAR